MRDPREQDLALECLRLAVSNGPASPDETVGRAESYLEFVTRDDAASTLRTVRAVVNS